MWLTNYHVYVFLFVERVVVFEWLLNLTVCSYDESLMIISVILHSMLFLWQSRIISKAFSIKPVLYHTVKKAPKSRRIRVDSTPNTETDKALTIPAPSSSRSKLLSRRTSSSNANESQSPIDAVKDRPFSLPSGEFSKQ